MPLIASRQLSAAVGGYGVLFSALGVGALMDALSLGAVKQHLSSNSCSRRRRRCSRSLWRSRVHELDVDAISLLMLCGFGWPASVATVAAELQPSSPTGPGLAVSASS